MKILVIVESSTKEKTIKKCLEAAFSRENNSYTVKASGGHICDLVKQDFGLNLKTLQPISVLKKVKQLVCYEICKTNRQSGWNYTVSVG